MLMYNDFAGIYDKLMQEVPYEKWSLRIDEWIKEYSADTKQLVELGCGTGTLTELMADLGYDMIGIDSSTEMLNVAMDKKLKSESNILYLNQDMQELELYNPVGTIICVCDSLNYLLTDDKILKTFKRVNHYLCSGGIFIFDFNTNYKYETVIGDSTIAESHGNCAFIWENFYDPESSVNTYELTFFIEEEDGRYKKYEETHHQKGYKLEQISYLLNEAGLDFVLAIDDETEDYPDEKSERIFVVARKGVINA